MILEQRRRFGSYAKAYAALFIRHRDKPDGEIAQHLSMLLNDWAEESIDEDPRRASECWQSAKDILPTTDNHIGERYRERMFLGKWGASGLPTLIPSDAHWAASMCGTNVAPELLESLRLPWDAFWIEVPPELGLTIGPDPEGGPVRRPVVVIGVNRINAPTDSIRHSRYGERWMSENDWIQILVWSEATTWLRPGHRSCRIRELGDDLDPEEGDDGSDYEQYLRGQKMVGKLVVGCILALDAGQTHQPSAKSKERRRRSGKVPTDLEFVVGVPVHVRMVDFVRDYIRVGPRRMTGPRRVQTLVRGHWKRQPYGPNSTLRKLIHIEPHWSGPIDAPVAVRPHIVHSPGDAQAGITG